MTVTKIKSVLTLLTIVFLWLGAVIILNFYIWYLYWFVAIPLSIGFSSALTYFGFTAFEKVR